MLIKGGGEVALESAWFRDARHGTNTVRGLGDCKQVLLQLSTM